MLKPDSLRAALTEAVVVDGVKLLEREPDKLAIFIDQGRIAGRAGGALGFEWRYRLQAILTDFTGNVDAVALAVMLWIAEHQPELLENHASANEAIKFDADIIDGGTIDLALTLELNEAVDAVQRPNGPSGEPGGFDLVHRPEPVATPPFDDVPETTPLLQFYSGGELILDFTPEP